mgnify:CR=1 FL=1
MSKIKHPKVYSKLQTQRIGDAGKIVAEILGVMEEECKIGITTKEVDDKCKKYLKKIGAISGTYGYQGFPAYSCISIDDVVLHGVPDHTIIKEGMLIGIDCPVQYKGMYADAAINVEIGNISTDAKKINKISYDCLMSTLELIRPGITIGDICKHQFQYAYDRGYKVVTDFQGHGVGKQLHEPPYIPYFYNPNNPYNSYKLKKGNIVAIEPCLLTQEKLLLLKDGWSIKTSDGTIGTAWEHTIVVTDNGYKILTLL